MIGKKELAEIVAEKSGIKKNKANAVVTALFEVITQTVAGGDSVQVVGFGTFTSHERAARKGINPATKEAIEIAASKAPVFKPGKTFKDAVNN